MGVLERGGARYGMCGMVWYGVWGVAWCGMVWYGEWGMVWCATIKLEPSVATGYIDGSTHMI